jgi:hypothetical protein
VFLVRPKGAMPVSLALSLGQTPSGVLVTEPSLASNKRPFYPFSLGTDPRALVNEHPHTLLKWHPLFSPANPFTSPANTLSLATTRASRLGTGFKAPAAEPLWAFNLLAGHPSRISTNARVRFTPSSIGLGLDESRLIRTGASRLADTAMIANKLESVATPSLTLPLTPVSALSLGWSTSTSLSAYPSYKLSRGGVFRRPFTGVSSRPNPIGGLKESFNLLNLSKTTTHVGLPLLTLVSPSMPKFYASAPSLDTQVGAWSSVWSVLTPAPTEDLDPTFINSKWTPEVNTTRRSDHNSRYLVSWSPLLGSLSNGTSINPALSGPGVRGAQSPSALRSSLLALNELGLKNSFGVRGVKPVLLQSQTLSGGGSYSPSTAPSSSYSSIPASSKWVALWGSLPYPSTNAFVSSASQFSPDRLSGRGASLLTSKGLLLKSGALTSASNHLGGGDRINPLVDSLAKLGFSNLGNSELEVRPRQGYVPLNSDISVSRRLRVTKGVTLPSDTPMHVICGSKDVIHSWAIPGLNVKIDCIPGYNSHRRLLLRWRGAY